MMQENGNIKENQSTQTPVPWWKRVLKTTVKALLLFTCIWLCILLAAKVILSPSVLNRLIDRYAAEYVEGEVSVGKVSLSAFRFFPSIGITAEDFSITYPADRFDSVESEGAQGHLASRGLGENADTLASFRSFTISINLASLMNGKISIPYAALIQPRIFAHRYHDGQANWDIIRIPTDTTASEDIQEQDSGELPEIKIGRIRMSDNPHIVYSDSKDTIFAVANLRQMRFNGHLKPKNNARNRVGLKLDSLFVAGRIAQDTIAFGIDDLGIIEKDGKMRIRTKAKALLATRAFGRMDVPIEISSSLEFPKDTVPNIAVSDLKADIASIPLEGNANVRILEDRAGIKADLHINECRIADIIDKYLKNYISEAGKIKTDALVSLDMVCEGDYIYSDGTLPKMDMHISIPESTVRHKEIDSDISLHLEAGASTDEGEKIAAAIDQIRIRCEGLSVSGSGSIPDMMENDMELNLDGNITADLNKLLVFVPDSIRIKASGLIEAALKGSMRMSQMTVENLSGSDIIGRLYGEEIDIDIPQENIKIKIDSLGVEVGPEKKTSTKDTTQTFLMMAIKAGARNAVAKYGTIDFSGTGLKLSAMNSAASKGRIGHLGGTVSADRLTLSDDTGTGLEMKKTKNSFQMIPKEGRPEVPVLSLSSSNSNIILKNSNNRAILTTANFTAKAAMNTLERRVRMRMFMDSLAKAYPYVPKDSLMAHFRARMQVPQLPDWMQEEDFRKQDIDIKLDETMAKYFREWDVEGNINVRTGILMTPYFPVRNLLRGFDLDFDNDKLAIKDFRIRPGKSELHAEGELSGLRRALLGRGTINLDLDINADQVDANELLAAYNAGSSYTPPEEGLSKDDISDADFLKMVTGDSLEVNDTVTPLIVIPGNLNADIRLNGKDITYSDLLVNEFHSELIMKERCVQLSESCLHTSLGDIHFEGFYATRSKKDIKTGFNINMTDISAEGVVGLMPAIDTIMPLLKSFNGLLDCEIAATASIDTNMNIIFPSIDGIMRITGKDLSIKDNEMFHDLASKLMFKNKNEGYIKEMSVEGVISNSTLEIFPFVLTLDRYSLALSGIQNMDQSFRYHASLLKSPFLIKLGVDLYGDSFDDMKFKIGKAKYKSANVPIFTTVIDTTKINLVNSIRGIFEKGVDAAVKENEKRESIERHKHNIGYVRAVDQEMEALTDEEKKQMEEESKVIQEKEAAEEALSNAIKQINNNNNE